MTQSIRFRIVRTSQQYANRSLTTSRNKASTGKGFDASGVGDSHPDAPYRPRYVGVQDNGNFHFCHRIGGSGKTTDRMETCMNKDEAFIRQCAARNLSKSHTAQLLGFWPSVFPGYLEALGLGDIEWCKGSNSLLALQQRRDSGAARTGVTQDYLTDEDRRIIRDRNLARAPKYTAFGVTGTLSQLVEKFGVVGKNAVVYRTGQMGMSIEEALTQPRADIAFRRARNPESHPWRRDAAQSIAAYRERTGQLAHREAS